MADKKMTKRDYFNAIKALVVDNAELSAFVEKELAALDKKASKKAKTSPETAQARADILEVLKANADKEMSIKDLAAAAKVSSQRATAAVKYLVDNKMAVPTSTVKRTNYFKVA